MNISKMNPVEIQSAVKTCISKSVDLTESNSFLSAIHSYIAPAVLKLQQAIDKANAEARTEKISNSDDTFDSSIKTFRSVVNSKAEAKALGAESEACSAIANVLNDKGYFEERSRKQQIVVMNSVRRLLSTEEMINNLHIGGVEKLYTPVVDCHDELVALMNERAGFTSDLRDIPSPSDAAKEVKPILSKLYKHIKDFAEIGDEVYAKLLRDIDEDLKPITIQIKARITRYKKCAAE